MFCTTPHHTTQRTQLTTQTHLLLIWINSHHFGWFNSSCSVPHHTCLPENTSVRTPNRQCPYFQIFDQNFLQMHHQSVKTKQCQRSIFLSFILEEQCVNSHFPLYRCTTLERLYFYICESRSRSKTAEHILQKQCTV